MLCFDDHVSLSAQNGVNPDWEKKVIEYFKEKLKENNAPKWVSLLLFTGRELAGCSFSQQSRDPHVIRSREVRVDFRSQYKALKGFGLTLCCL